MFSYTDEFVRSIIFFVYNVPCIAVDTHVERVSKRLGLAKKLDNVYMNILSMGMSDDYDLAIKCGANMVRIGSALYGKRIYN